MAQPSTSGMAAPSKEKVKPARGCQYDKQRYSTKMLTQSLKQDFQVIFIEKSSPFAIDGFSILQFFQICKALVRFFLDGSIFLC